MSTTRELIMTYVDIQQDLEMVELLPEEEREQAMHNLMEQSTRLVVQIKNKADGIDKFLFELDRADKVLEAEHQALKNEIERLQRRRRATERTKKYFNETLLPMIVQECGTDGVFETNISRYKLYETYSGVDVCTQECDPKFIRTKIIEEPNKVEARKAAIEAMDKGEPLPKGITIYRVKRVKRS